MLETSITTTNRDGQVLHRITIDIESANRLALADFVVRERDEAKGIRAEIVLTGYPRWSEPRTALVARAMAALPKASTEDDSVQDVTRIHAETKCIGTDGSARLIFGWLLRDSGVGNHLIERWDECSISDSMVVETRTGRDSSVLERILEGQCLAVWGEPELRHWPAPLSVPVRTKDAVEYVLSSDMPDYARYIFNDRMRGSPQPVLAGEGPCYFSRDWQAFLCGSR